MIYEYKGALYPNFLRTGNACQHIAATALHFCKGKGLDIGAGKWPLPGADPIDVDTAWTAMELPHGLNDFIFSSHALEHLSNPIAALEHWKTRLRQNGVLFLYLPHPDMTYWLPQHNRRHLHSWRPAEMAQILRDLGFVNVLHSERDMAWSFCAIGFKGKD